MPSSPGEFSYPPSGSNLQFNTIDLLVTSWTSFDANATVCILRVYLKPEPDGWREGYNQTAAANGTATIPLDLADGSGYTGQLKFFYTNSQGARKKFTSPWFSVASSSRSQAVTFGEAVKKNSTSSVSASSASSAVSSSARLHTSIMTSMVISRASPVTVRMSDGAPTVLSSSAISSPLPVQQPTSISDTHLGSGAIAGIVIGALVAFCAGLAAAYVFYRRSKPSGVQTAVEAASPVDFQSSIPAKFGGEKDGSPVRSNELAGDGPLFEMGSGNR